MRWLKNVKSSSGKDGVRMKDKILENPGLKLISLICAFLLWLMVVSVDDPIVTRTFSQVNVELLNTDILTDNGDYYEVADNTDNISITATGKRSIIDSLSRDNFRATADIEKMNGNLVPIEVKATKFADVLDSVYAKTQNVRLDIEGLEDKYVDIVVVAEGNVESGSILGSVTSNRNSVHISGPESVINSIDKANVIVDVAGLSTDASLTEEMAFVDEMGFSVNDDRVKSNINSVTVDVEVWKSKEVSLVYGYTGVPMAGYGFTGDISINPATIMIAADKSVLNSLSEIVIPSSAVDVNGAMSDLDIPVNLTNYLPSGVVLYGEEDSIATVHVGISALLSKNIQIPTNNIVINNAPADMEAAVAEPNSFVVVMVSGIGNNFLSLDENMITGVVDLAGLELQKDSETDAILDYIYDVPVTFTLPAGVEAVPDTKVKVLVKKPGATGEEGTNTNADTSDEDEESED